MSAREHREEALLAMCVASPADGREYLDRLTPEHFSSPAAARAWTWLREHPEDPTDGLERDDEELWAYVTRVAMRSEREPASPAAMELNFLELELARVDDQIAAANEDGGEPPVDLHRRRGELAEQIAHFDR